MFYRGPSLLSLRLYDLAPRPPPPPSPISTLSPLPQSSCVSLVQPIWYWWWRGREGGRWAGVEPYLPPKGVGPSTTLSWPGWKQPDNPVEVDTARLETCWFKNGFAKCVLLYFPSIEFESTFNAYWNGVGAAGLSCTELSILEFPFLREGGGAVGSGGIVYDIVWMGCPRRTPWKCCVHLYAFVSYRRLSPQFQFSLSAVTLVYLSRCSHPPHHRPILRCTRSNI